MFQICLNRVNHRLTASLYNKYCQYKHCCCGFYSSPLAFLTPTLSESSETSLHHNAKMDCCCIYSSLLVFDHSYSFRKLRIQFLSVLNKWRQPELPMTPRYLPSLSCQFPSRRWRHGVSVVTAHCFCRFGPCSVHHRG